MAVGIRFLTCFGGLAVTGLLFPGSCTLWGLLFGTLLCGVLYVLIRPLVQAVILPFNLVLAGVLTPLTDALLVQWASAWVWGLRLSYWQSLFAAVVMLLLMLPYSAAKKRRLLQK